MAYVTAVHQTLSYLNDQMAHSMAEREQGIARTRAYWDAKPRTMLNERLKLIELDKHYAEFTLKTAAIRAERETLLDALAQIEMVQPTTIIVPSSQLQS